MYRFFEEDRWAFSGIVLKSYDDPPTPDPDPDDPKDPEGQ